MFCPSKKLLGGLSLGSALIGVTLDGKVDELSGGTAAGALDTVDSKTASGQPNQGGIAPSYQYDWRSFQRELPDLPQPSFGRGTPPSATSFAAVPAVAVEITPPSEEFLEAFASSKIGASDNHAPSHVDPHEDGVSPSVHKPQIVSTRAAKPSALNGARAHGSSIDGDGDIGSGSKQPDSARDEGSEPEIRLPEPTFGAVENEQQLFISESEDTQDPYAAAINQPSGQAIDVAARVRKASAADPIHAHTLDRVLDEFSVLAAASPDEYEAEERRMFQPESAGGSDDVVSVTGFDDPTFGKSEAAIAEPMAMASHRVTDRETGAFADDEAGQPNSSVDPLFGYDDELILQLRVTGTSATETIIAYGTRDGTYLPVGELSRLLDLPIQISDGGNYASGWYLSEDRTVSINLRQGTIELPDRTIQLERTAGQAFDGETYLRSDLFAEIFPLEVEIDLRSQAIILTTLEPFPFEERMRRRAERERLNLRANAPQEAAWPRKELPYAAFSFPIVDAEIRAVSDVPRGERFEGDFRIAGDLAFLTAQTFLSATTRDGLTAALVELGRRDADGQLLGPLQATEFAIGDVATLAMPVGLRGAFGRGAFISNQSLDGFSVFEEIDFRGVLLEGYEVELYRNDILLGSTRDRVNGQYEFLQIPVDYGLNVFRLVFYGPQGQRREEVRRISVGDGRLASGGFQYAAGFVERGVNLLGVEGPDFRRDARFGDLQAVAEFSYGLNASITLNASGAFFQDRGSDRWIASSGIRSGLGGLAVRTDVALSDGGGTAFGVGLGGRALGGGFRLTHYEYSGPFVDELRATGTQPLSRATEVDFNTSIGIGDNLYLPLTLRGRRVAFQDGRIQTNASLRASTRFSGFIASSAIGYVGLSAPTGSGFDQTIASFDLATFNRSATQVRGSLGFRLFPDSAITQATAEVSHRLDDSTVIRASAGYAFENGGALLGFSAVREFDRFSLALDSQYDFDRDDHVVALRLNFSFGRDPVRNSFFVGEPGMAGSGAVAVRAFHDLDGDQIYSAGDVPLPDVTITSANASTTTDELGRARIGHLGNGNRAVVQLDPSSLPDIYMAPVNRGIQVEPRAGRFQTLDFAVVELSEIEGTVTFEEEESARGVSGLRLQMYDQSRELVDIKRTERGGYFFFERVPPGTYDFVIDPEQADRLNLCLSAPEPLTVASLSEIYEFDLTVRYCEPEPREQQASGS